MAVQEILRLGNPTLWEASAPVADVHSPSAQTLIRDLDDTLRAFYETNGFGRAIAAPQIGVLQRGIFLRMHSGGFCGIMLNPEIVWADTRQIELWDDCFSFPDLLVKVKRAARIRVSYQDAEGHRQELDATGDVSELLQHEIDHLDGILAVERAISPQAFALRTEWERWHREIGMD